MTNDQKEQAVAAHVEALIELGWRWEGRGLVPTIGTKRKITAKRYLHRSATKFDSIRYFCIK